MYERFFDLQENPFTIAPNPRYLYMSQAHQEALAHLLYGVQGATGGFIVLTGEVGTGKTTLCRCFLAQLSPTEIEVALIFNPPTCIEELLIVICSELGIHIPAESGGILTNALIQAINQHLLAVYAKGRKTLLMIDEAQNLSYAVLEQLRLLTNLETNEAKLLQIILLGQPELKEMLAQTVLRQLAQRITARYHLEGLSYPDTCAYVAHRLAVAGCHHSIFQANAMRLLFTYSRGLPRLINLLCDRALLGAYALDEHGVNKKIMRHAAQEVLDITDKYRWLFSLFSGGTKRILRYSFFVLILASFVLGVLSLNQSQKIKHFFTSMLVKSAID